MPLSLPVMVTVAPGIAALAGSVTEPAIALVVSPCAMARRQKDSAARTRNPYLGMPKYIDNGASSQLAVFEEAEYAEV